MPSFFNEPISRYTDQDGIDDGLLFKLSDVKQFKDFSVGIITTGLMDLGYWAIKCGPCDFKRMCPERDSKPCKADVMELNVPNLMDLTFQIAKYIQKSNPDLFYSLKVELPSGTKQQIFVVVNETGKFTVMLPSEY